MMNVALIAASLGFLWICTGTAVAVEKPRGGEKASLVRDRAIVLKNNEYMLMPWDYGMLEKGGSLLVKYPPGKESRWVAVSAFYFENVRGRVVNATARPVSGNTAAGEPEYLVEISPVFPLDPQEAWYLKRKSKPAELFRKKVAISHMDQEYTFRDHKDAEEKLAHGVLANALVSGGGVFNPSRSGGRVQVPAPLSIGGNEDATDDAKGNPDRPGTDGNGNDVPASSGQVPAPDFTGGFPSGSSGGPAMNPESGSTNKDQSSEGADSGKTFTHAEFSGSPLEVAAGRQVQVADVLIHAAASGIWLGEDASLILASVPSSDLTVSLNVSYGDGNFSLSSPDSWMTNTLITGMGQASIDFSGGVNLVLTDCSRGLIEQLVADHVTTITFVLYDKDALINTFKGDPSKALVLYDAALKNAGFMLKNGDSWTQDGVVTLVRDGAAATVFAVPEPGTAALGLLGAGALLLRRRRK